MSSSAGSTARRLISARSTRFALAYVSRTDSGVPGAQDDVVTTVTAKTVYVDVVC